MWLFNSGAELLILFILINLNLSNMWLVATLLAREMREMRNVLSIDFLYHQKKWDSTSFSKPQKPLETNKGK